MSWLFSRPLAFQLIIVVIGAFVFSLIVSFYLFVYERRTALRDASAYQAVFRTVTIARALQATDPLIHRQIIRVSSSRRWQYWISESPAVTSPQDLPYRARAIAALRDRFPDMADQLLFQRDGGDPAPALKRHSRPNIDGRPPPEGRPPPKGDRPPADGRRPRQHQAVTVSVPLLDGTWLNGAALEAPVTPPIGWQPVAFLALLLASIVGVLLLLISRVTRPLSALAAAADKLGRGETLGPVPEHGPKEVRVTTRAFNSMQDRLTRYVDDRTRMLAAISHDLRTPITALRLRAEMLDDDETRDRMLETLDTMAQMTDATLSFMRDASSSEETSKVDLAALVASVSEDFRDMGNQVSWTVPDRLIYPCRSNGLRRVLSNLIENAVRYGSEILVDLHEAHNGIEIVVRDDGPGIPDEKLAAVFKPFERLDTARNTESGNVGLGLAISRSIVQAHGGDLTLENRPEGGLEARVSLPIVDD